jgi:eukaryotic-like serine/threonine-protein kinase
MRSELDVRLQRTRWWSPKQPIRLSPRVELTPTATDDKGYEVLSSRATPETAEIPLPLGSSLLCQLLDGLIILPEEWEELPSQERDEIAALPSRELLLGKLVQRHLLTPFQSDRLREGLGDGLVLNHYRLLDVLGRGGMGTVYRAEHVHLRRQVAIKVMTRTVGGNARLLHRFYAEARAVAKLQHPNIVACFDAGRVNSAGTGAARDYFVMELIPGQDLYGLVREKGPLSTRRACEIFRQVADALGEAHRLRLIHRDIKPGNILVTPDWQAKVLDFGLARLPSGNVTEPGTVLGTIGYMAPEQARDPSGVDARADLFSLGATMYWALTGREPYPETGNPVHDFHRRLTARPDPVRQVRPEVPTELSDLVSRLMHTNPEERYPSARAVASALTGLGLWLSTRPSPETEESASRRDRVLLVDDDPNLRKMMRMLLAGTCDVREAPDADAALAEVTRDPPHLAVVDVHLPDTNGPELIARIRKVLPDPERVKILLVSGALPAEALGGLASAGADDFLTKPFTPSDFQSRVRSLLLRRSDAAKKGQATIGGTVRIPATATVRASAPSAPAVRPLVTAEALSFTVSQLLVDLGMFAPGHWKRIGQSVRAMAAAASGEGEYARLKDDTYLDLLAAFAPVYDVGLLGVPRSVLMKPDRFNADEASVVQTHATQGAELLAAVAARFGSEVAGLSLAAEVARSHHERWGGNGYPDMLAGVAIPLSARVVSIASVYEAVRSRRPHRPAMPHARAVKIIATESDGQFDPVLLTAFSATAPRFEAIYQIK